jgi:hypothetical protein
MMNRRERGSERKLQKKILRCALICVLTALAMSAAPEGAFARTETPPSPEEELIEAQLDYERASGLEAYLALREIWGLWEIVDPLRIEQALILAAEDKNKPAQLRAYARMLSSYSRLRRGDLASAQRSFTDAGYVTDWLIAGPFDNEGKAGFDQDFGPDAEPASPVVPGRAFSGKERPVRYRTLPPVFRYGWVDFGNLLRPSTHIRERCDSRTGRRSSRDPRK